MKFNIKTLLIVSMACLTVVACKKKEDDDDAPKTSSKSTLLTSHDWKMTNLQADPPFDSLFNWNSVDACEKDDVISFNTNGNGTFDEGITKCEPTDPQTSSFNWTWLESETQLRIIEDMDTTLLENVTINSTTLVGKQNFGEIPGFGVIYATITLSKL